jgi:hypothetical protein
MDVKTLLTHFALIFALYCCVRSVLFTTRKILKERQKMHITAFKRCLSHDI